MRGLWTGMPLAKIGRALDREVSFYRTAPRVAHLEPTYRCNLKCQMCTLWKNKAHRASDELTIEEWYGLLDSLQRLGVNRVVVAGAEPLMRAEDTLAIIRRARANGMHCTLITNGTLMSGDIAKAIVETGLDRISVSIDAPDELHGAIRGVPKTFEKATAGIKKIVDAKRSAGSSKPSINVHTTVMASNVSFLEGTPALVKAIGADTYSFQAILNIPKSIVERTVFDGKCIASDRYTFEQGSLNLTPRAVDELREKIARIEAANGLGMDLRVLGSMRDQHLLEGTFPVRRCYIVKNSITIGPTGDIHPCSVIGDYSIGNCREEQLDQIWHGPRFEALRKRLERGLFPACSYCCYFNYNLTFGQAFKVLLNKTLN